MRLNDLHWATRASASGLALTGALVAGDGQGADATPVAASRADALLGEWWTEGKEGRVRFTRDPDGTFRGTTTCCTPARPGPDHPAQDIHNPDPKLRGRSTVGIAIIWKLAYEDGEYSDGYVYNPRDGKTYRFAAEIIDDGTVEVRGYLGIRLLGQSQIWKRVQAAGARP